MISPPAGSVPAEITQQLIPARDADGKMIQSVTYHDTDARHDGSHTYFITAEEWSSLEGNPTGRLVYNAATAQPGPTLPPLQNFDKAAPPAVAGFTATREEPGQYRLKWTASPASDLRYYNVYFSNQARPEITQKRLVVSPLKDMTSYLDWSAPSDGIGFYVITAVDRQGNESPPAFVEVK